MKINVKIDLRPIIKEEIVEVFSGTEDECHVFRVNKSAEFFNLLSSSYNKLKVESHKLHGNDLDYILVSDNGHTCLFTHGE